MLLRIGQLIEIFLEKIVGKSGKLSIPNYQVIKLKLIRFAWSFFLSMNFKIEKSFVFPSIRVVCIQIMFIFFFEEQSLEKRVFSRDSVL